MGGVVYAPVSIKKVIRNYCVWNSTATPPICMDSVVMIHICGGVPIRSAAEVVIGGCKSGYSSRGCGNTANPVVVVDETAPLTVR